MWLKVNRFIYTLVSKLALLSMCIIVELEILYSVIQSPPLYTWTKTAVQSEVLLWYNSWPLRHWQTGLRLEVLSGLTFVSLLASPSTKWGGRLHGTRWSCSGRRGWFCQLWWFSWDWCLSSSTGSWQHLMTLLLRSPLKWLQPPLVCSWRVSSSGKCH